MQGASLDPRGASSILPTKLLLVKTRVASRPSYHGMVRDVAQQACGLVVKEDSVAVSVAGFLVVNEVDTDNQRKKSLCRSVRTFDIHEPKIEFNIVICKASSVWPEWSSWRWVA